MTPETSARMVSGTDQKNLTSGNACWETPPAVFAKLNADFGPFDLDLTADAGRALCPRWFGPGANRPDALTALWSWLGCTGYSNPPYGKFAAKLIRKARQEAGHSFTSTLLLPMRVTAAFKRDILPHAAELLFCDSRITFWENGSPRINPRTGKLDRAMFDSIVVRFIAGHTGGPKVGVWQVPPHAPGQRGYVSTASQARWNA